MLALNLATQNPHSTLLAQNFAPNAASKGIQAAQEPSQILLAQNENADTIGAAAQNGTQDSNATRPSVSSRPFGSDTSQSQAPRDFLAGSKINTYELGAVEITAPQEVDFNPAVYSISKQDFKDLHAESLSDAVRTAPGVYFQEFNLLNISNIYIRGYDRTQIGHYIDGIPMNDVYIGNNKGNWDDYDVYPTSSLLGVQISKGYASPIYGTNILGGAVNMLSAKPQKELEITLSMKNLYGRKGGVSPQQLHQDLSIGSNQGKFYVQVDASHTDRQSYPFPYSYDGTEEANRGKKSGAKFQNIYGKLTLGWRPNENHEYSLNYIRQVNSKSGFGNNTATATSLNNYEQDTGYEKTKNTLYLLGKTFFNPDLSLNSRLYYQDNYMDMPGMSGRWVYDNTTYGAIFDASWDIAARTNLKFGVNEKYDIHKGTVGYSSVSATNPGADLRELKSSVFAQIAQGLGPVRLVLSGSYERLDILRARYSSPTTFKHSDMWDYSVQGALYYDFAENNTAHIAVGKKKTWPTMHYRHVSHYGSYYLDPNADAESAYNYEVGYDLRMRSSLGSTFISGAAYFNDMKNMFVFQNYYTPTAAESICPGPSQVTSGVFQNWYLCSVGENIDHGYTYGGEIAVEQGFFDDKFAVGINYSYIEKYTKNATYSYNHYGATRLKNYANHQLNGKFAVRAIKDLDIVALWTYHSPTWNSGYTSRTRNDDGSYTYNGIFYYKHRAYVTVDLALNYHIAKGLSVNLAAYNIFDRINSFNNSSAGSFTYYVQPGRRFVVGVEYKY